MLGQRLGSKLAFSGGRLYPSDDESGGFSSKDATSGKFVPATSAEWSGAGYAAPDYVWLCQEAAGNLADTGGAGKTLTAAGSVAYHQVIAGWSRFAVGNQGLGTAATFSNATMDNINASSVAFLVLAQFAQPTTGNDRAFWGAAATNSLQNVSAGTVQRLRTGANAANGVLSHVGAVHPFWVVYSIGGSRNALYSDIEKVSVTFGAAAGATLQISAGTTDVNFTNQVLAAYGWKGANADSWTDATVKSALTAQGWAVSGY